MLSQSDTKVKNKVVKPISKNPPTQITTKMYSKGTIRIPAAIKNDMHLKDGDELLFIRHGSEWALTTREKMLKEAQAYFALHNSQKISLVDELIAERHKEAEEE